MARSFVATSSQFVYTANAVVASAPLSMACWFYPLDVTSIHTLMAVVDQGGGTNGDFHTIWARGDQTGDPIWATSFNNTQGSSVSAATTAAFVASSWQHGCAVFAAADDRRVYLNGGNKGTNATSRAPASLSHTSIGELYRSDNPAAYMTGYVAEAAIWNVALTDADVLVLAQGICPKLVRPAGLVAYWPLIASDIDPVGMFGLTASGSPTFAAHPRMYYPGLLPVGMPIAPVAYVPRYGFILHNDPGLV